MGEEVLGLDRRFHPVLAQYLPADVDLKGRVRRVWTDNRAPQVLLSRNSWSRQSLSRAVFSIHSWRDGLPVQFAKRSRGGLRAFVVWRRTSLPMFSAAVSASVVRARHGDGRGFWTRFSLCRQ